jgi:hypothetical protein
MKLKIFYMSFIFSTLQFVGCEKEKMPNNNRSASEKMSPERALKLTPKPTIGSSIKRRVATSPTDEVTIQTKRLKILHETEEFIGRQVDELSADEWRKLKQYYWTKTLDQVISQTKEHEPKPSLNNLLATATGKDPLIPQLLSGKFTDIKEPAEQEFLIATHLVAIGAAANGGATLPEAVGDRADDPQITRGDLFIFEVFIDAFIEVSNRKPISLHSKDQWNRLAGSSNSLYRLLALRTFRRVEIDPKQWLTFYSGYLNEKDQDIFKEAISLASQPEIPGSLELLSQFRAACTAATPQSTIEDLEVAIKWIEKCNP